MLAEASGAERRGHCRAPVSVLGTVESASGEHPIVLLNLSAGGAMLQAHEPPEPDVIYQLRFNIHKRSYELPFQPLYWLQQGGSYGWRGPFVEVAAEQQQAIERAVQALAGTASSDLRTWQEVRAEAERQPDARVLIGTTPAGHDIHVLGTDVLEMGSEGLELYARLMCELETA